MKRFLIGLVHSWGGLWFGLWVMLGSALLFVMELVAGKKALILFGGGSGVWSVSLLFFQVVLLLGYGYGYWLVRVKKKVQIGIHLALVGVVGVWLVWGLLGGGLFKTVEAEWGPIWGLLIFLCRSIGPVFFLLSTSTLVGSYWYVGVIEKVDVYILYALSNLGSVVGLLLYPLVLERWWGLEGAERAWSWGMLVYILTVMRVGAGVWNRDKKIGMGAKRTVKVTSGNIRWDWVLIAAISAMLLVVVTERITTVIAPVPLVWMFPLLLYLLSYGVIFSRKVGGRVQSYSRMLLISGLVALVIKWWSGNPLVELLFLGVVMMFGFVVLHLWLYRLRPKENGVVGSYYMHGLVGSVLGTMLVAVVAAQVFTEYVEYYLVIGVVVIMSVVWSVKWGGRKVSGWMFSVKLLGWIFLGVMVVWGEVFAVGGRNEAVERRRNFYGVSRVERSEGMRWMVNGSVVHGSQFEKVEKAQIPTSYFGMGSGVDMGLKKYREWRQNKGSIDGLRIGVIGLGVGTLASYGEEGDEIVFVEINPQVIDLAERRFTYLEESRACVSVIEGDGRIVLGEMEDRNADVFDVLVLDAFSGDGIPVHLLTREAFLQYWQRLEMDGLLIVHVSNDYLELGKLLKATAKDLELEMVYIDHHPEQDYLMRSMYVLLTRRPGLLEEMGLWEYHQELGGALPRVWTDNYSSVFGVMKWRR